MSLAVLETSRTRPVSMNASARTPSHLNSTDQAPRPADGDPPGTASIGVSAAGSGSRSRWIIQFLPPVANRA